jgi:hypothetical protein
MGGDDHLDAPYAADVREVAGQLLLPGDVQRDLGLVDDREGAGRAVEQQVVDDDHHLLLARRQLGQLDGCAVVHRYDDLAGVRNRQGLVYEEVVHDVLEHHHGLGQQAVPGGVLVQARYYLDVIVPVLGELVPGRGEPVPGGYPGDEARIGEELHPGLDVLGELLELGVGHLGQRRGVGIHELGVLLGGAEGLG